VTVAPHFQRGTFGHDPENGHLDIESGSCPHCARLIVRGVFVTSGGQHTVTEQRVEFWPSRRQRRVAPEIPDEYADDFVEAAAVLPLSAKASAAVSRRLLQHTIREKAGIKKRNLDDEIQALTDSNTLPADLGHDLDALRTLGNFAAHPIKSTNTGEVVDVEPGEAEWLVEVLEELLDFYFVRPAVRETRRTALNTKLQDAGKPELKGTEQTPASPPPVL